MFLITQDNKVYKAQVYLHDNGMALAERLLSPELCSL